MTLDDCRRLDAEDPLAALRDRFLLPEGVIYLDGNSLGVLPKSAPARIAEVVAKEWGEGLIRSWNSAGWFDLPQRLGDKVARLVGAAPGEVVCTDSTSINLYKVLFAALSQHKDSGRKLVVSERSNFPTDLYIAESLCRERGFTLKLIDANELQGVLTDDVAVLMLTHVNYKSGEMLDMAALTELAHARGALTVWDLCHSAGAVPVALNASKADYAIGCTYKYLNGGPGSPAFVWVAPALRDAFWQPLSGWWGHAAPFAMDPQYRPVDGVRRFLCGTQPITSMAMVECGLDIFAQTDMSALRTKSLQLTDLFIALVEERCRHHPLTLVTPREHARRGSQVSFEHPEGYAVMQALIERGVIGDYREPRIIRFGFTPLYTSFTEVWDAVETLRDVLDTETYRDARFHARGAVT